MTDQDRPPRFVAVVAKGPGSTEKEEGALDQMELDSGGPREDAVGKMGRVSVPISPGVAGEVIIQIRGGSEAYTAYTQGEELLEVNRRIVVVEQLSSRTLLVTGC